MPQHLAGVYEHQRSCVSSQRGRVENTSAQFTRCMSFHHRAVHQSDLTQLCRTALKPVMYSSLELMEDVSASDGKPAFIHVLHSLYQVVESFQYINQWCCRWIALSLHYLEAFERWEVIFVFTQNLPPPSEAAAAALNFHWDSDFFFFFFLLKVNNPDPPGCSDRPLTHTQLMSLKSLTHRFCKFLPWKLHSCLGPRLRWRRLCGRFKRNHRGFPFTFPRTAVINQQLMISMADMRGAAELLLLITFSDSLAHVCVRVCVNEISPVPKRPCFYPPSLFSTLNNVSFFSLSYLNILVTVVVLSGVVILSIYFKYCEPVKQFTLRHQSDGWRSRRVDLIYHQIYSAVW